MAIVKIRTNRQITIPKLIFDDLGLKEGEFVEVTQTKGNRVVITPKKLLDISEEILTPEEEDSIHKGEEQLKKGEYVEWKALKKTIKL